MHMQPTPEPEEQDPPLERREEEDAMRGAGHDDPDTARERAGLGGQEPEPSGAPPSGD